jgi:hypothetical protein
VDPGFQVNVLALLADSGKHDSGHNSIAALIAPRPVRLDFAEAEVVGARPRIGQRSDIERDLEVANRLLSHPISKVPPLG